MKQSRRVRTLPVDEDNPVYDIIQAFKLLFKQRESDSTRTILSKLRSIFASEAISEVFTYFCHHGAATAWTLRNELEMSEATAYRALKQLRSLGFIVPAIKVSKLKRSKGGPRPTVWALEGASPDEVAEALMLHYQMFPPSEEGVTDRGVRIKREAGEEAGR